MAKPKEARMKNKKLLAIILLILSFCFVSGVGYGEIKGWKIERKASILDMELLDARIRYMMWNPDTFLYVDFYYDEYGVYGVSDRLPKSVDTKEKIYIQVGDTRGAFSQKNKKALLNELKRQLEYMCSYLEEVTTDMAADIVAVFYSEEEITLGYFYQGEYHLWEE